MKPELTPVLRQRIVDILADIPRSKSVNGAYSELGLKLRKIPIEIDGRETRLSAFVTDSELLKIVEEYKKPKEDKVYPPMPAAQHQVIEGSDLHKLLLLIKQPGALQAIEELAAVRAKKEETANTCLDYFRSVGEMESGEIDMVIDGVLQEGICFIGATPASGKTLVSLSLAKAICTGRPLFGVANYKVKKPRQVIYLIPESGDHAFRKRCEAFRIPDDKSKFMARTISAGVPLDLSDPILLEAVRQTNPVVFLDTASRFMKSNDENAAAQNRQLVNDVIALLAAGAVTVVLVHHATKKSREEAMTLENMLRGSSDLGAMCDQAYGIRKDSALYANGMGPMEIDLVNLKDREQLGGVTRLRLAASYITNNSVGAISYINTEGDLKVVDHQEMHRRIEDQLIEYVKADPTASSAHIANELGLEKSGHTVSRMLKNLGWHRAKGGPEGASPWHNDEGKPCPYQERVQTTKEAQKRAPNESRIATNGRNGTNVNPAELNQQAMLGDFVEPVEGDVVLVNPYQKEGD